MYLSECYPDLEVSPNTRKEHADPNRWLHWQSSHYGCAIGAHINGPSTQAQNDIQPLLAVLENQQKGRDYMCDSISPAEFEIGAYSLCRAAEKVDWSQSPNICAWKERLAGLKGFVETMPTTS